MKQLLALFAFVVVLGIGSLVYRNALERPFAGTNRQYAACPADAQMCPDGTSVARVAPACAFAACPFPNVTLSDTGMSYVVPSGFSAVPIEKGTSLIAAYERSPITGESGRIEIRAYQVPEEVDANTIVLETAQAAGAAVLTMLDFSPMLIEGKTFETVEVPDGEVLRTLYYHIGERSVLRLDAYGNQQAAIDLLTRIAVQ